MHKCSPQRFVVQRHTRPGDTHWDFMLEQNNALLTWRLALPPEQACRTSSDAIRIFDHPLRFLDYEGTVNNGTGSVKIADRGTCQLITGSSARLHIELAGTHFRGFYLLEMQQENQWTLSPIDVPTF